MLKFAILTVALLTTPTTQRQGEELQDEEHVLDTVVSTAPRLEGDRPTTGRVSLRPILNYNNRWSQNTNVVHVTFYFSPVIEVSPGRVERFPDPHLPDYRIGFSIPRSTLGSRFRARPSDFAELAVDLPGGTYAISRVSYRYIRPGRPDTNQVSYCLSEGSGLFEVENGASISLGILSVDDLSKNTAFRHRHSHFLTVDTSSSIPSRLAKTQADHNPTLIDIERTTFAGTEDLCSDAQLQTVGLDTDPRENRRKWW